MSNQTSSTQRSGKLEYKFQFDEPADIARIVKAVGMSPVKLTVDWKPEFIHETNDQDGNVVWRNLGPEFATYSLEGYLFCEDKFRSSTGFSYRGESFLVESRNIDRNNSDFITCRVSGTSHGNLVLPSEFVDTDGVAYGVQPTQTDYSTSEITVVFDEVFSSPPVVSQVHLALPGSGSPAVNIYVKDVTSTGATFVYDGNIEPGAPFHLSYSVSPFTTLPGVSTYRSGSDPISAGASSKTISSGYSYTLPWISAGLKVDSNYPAISGAVVNNTVSGGVFDYELESETSPSSSYDLMWEMREVGEYDANFAYGIIALSAGDTGATVDFSAWNFPGLPRFTKADLTIPNTNRQLIDANVDASSVNSRGMNVVFDAPIPAGTNANIYHLHWSARMI